MTTEHFIAKRIAFSKNKTFTKVIVRIAIAAIAVSVSVMILTAAIIDGFKQEISNKIFGFWGHIHITDSNINKNFELSPIVATDTVFDFLRNIKNIEYDKDVKLFGIQWEGKTQLKETFGGVRGVYPYIILPGLLSTSQLFHGVLWKGLGNEYDWQRINQFIIEGKPIYFDPDSISSDILVSKYIAVTLGLHVDDKVILSFIQDNNQIKRRVNIAGIYNTGLEEYDKRFIIGDIRKIQEIIGWRAEQVQGMEVVLEDVRDMEVISDYIYYEALPPQLYAESIRAKFPSIFDWLRLQDINEKIIFQLMLVVAIINMITVLLILILERTQMIGTLQSLGMDNWGIRKIFLYHAGYIVLIGLIIGNVLGIGIAMVQKTYKWIKLDEANYYLDTAPISIDWTTVLLLNGATFLITVMALIIPSILVTNITPIKALRFR